jgi:hypothetical protein
VCGLDSTGSGQGPVAGCCEYGDEPSGSCATELGIVLVKSHTRMIMCVRMSRMDCDECVNTSIQTVERSVLLFFKINITVPLLNPLKA